MAEETSTQQKPEVKIPDARNEFLGIMTGLLGVLIAGGFFSFFVVEGDRIEQHKRSLATLVKRTADSNRDGVFEVDEASQMLNRMGYQRTLHENATYDVVVTRLQDSISISGGPKSYNIIIPETIAESYVD